MTFVPNSTSAVAELIHPMPVTGDSINQEAELAFRFITETDRHVFLTGRAGTGKTTFLHRIRKTCLKQMAIAAPTGVAAINAKGVTLHSLFQLPFGSIMPNEHVEKLGQRKLSKEKQRLLRALDLLIIDEISMVRADVLDAIDWTLRRYRNPRRPFGGLQLLMIGDLHQLPPVVTDSEMYAMRQHYETPYFFSSLALANSSMVRIELKRIYRQTNTDFVALLNKVRTNQLDNATLELLNSRYSPIAGKGVADDDGVITLTSHRNAADRLNTSRLAALAGQKQIFKATVSGKFPEHAYPTEAQLELKVGAQVMFVKNDSAQAKAYFNGKLGTIISMTKEEVRVKCPDDEYPLSVSVATWENTKYKVNEKSKEVDELKEGSFEQIPLRLAWAITIHKSQGLTFDRVNIDAESAFAHGQVYVALSRCRTFEGISLLSKIGTSAVRTDGNVNSYAAKGAADEPGESDLDQAREDYRRQLVRDAFNFNALHSDLHGFLRFYLENERSYTVQSADKLEALVTTCDAQLISHAKNFAPLLIEIQQGQDFTSDEVPVNDRTVSAARYFYKGFDTLLKVPLAEINFSSDNKNTATRTKLFLTDIDRGIRVARASLGVCAKPFTIDQMVRARVAADLADQDSSSNKSSSGGSSKADQAAVVCNHPKLYASLYSWRKARAVADGIDSVGRICPSKAMIQIANDLPVSTRGLLAVSGVGKKTAENYGEQIIAFVQAYCEKHKLEGDKDLKKHDRHYFKLLKDSETREASFLRYQQNETIEQIAEARGIAADTVLGHLALYVAKGEIPLDKFVSESDELIIQAAILEEDKLSHDNDYALATAVRMRLQDRFSYPQIRMVGRSMIRPAAES